MIFMFLQMKMMKLQKKASNFEKGILCKLSGADLNRSKLNVNKDAGYEKQICSKFDECIYPATLFACSTKEGDGTNTSHMEIHSQGMFQKLYKYIQG